MLLGLDQGYPRTREGRGKLSFLLQLHLPVVLTELLVFPSDYKAEEK